MTRDELQRLIDLIVGEMALAPARPQSRCACHSVVDDCCPDRLRGVLDAGATRVGLLATGGAPASLASMIDHKIGRASRRERAAIREVPVAITTNGVR